MRGGDTQCDTQRLPLANSEAVSQISVDNNTCQVRHVKRNHFCTFRWKTWSRAPSRNHFLLSSLAVRLPVIISHPVTQLGSAECTRQLTGSNRVPANVSHLSARRRRRNKLHPRGPLPQNDGTGAGTDRGMLGANSPPASLTARTPDVSSSARRAPPTAWCSDITGNLIRSRPPDSRHRSSQS